jgi:phospholipid/cholesterol/gamma-HCH transport system substrate-binding protein
MGKNIVETIVGSLVLGVAIFFFSYAYRIGGVNETLGGYSLVAKFEQIDGVSIGTDIRIGGIKVGSITKDYLDKDTYQAILELNINHDVKIPTDSIASVVSSGLLGKKYISISPGAELAMLSDNGEIIHTQSSVNLETLIGKFMFSNNSSL